MSTSYNASEGRPDNVDPDSTVGRAAQTAHSAVDRAAERAQDGIDSLAQSSCEMLEVPCTAVRNHPMAAVVLALSVGYIFGRLHGD